MAIANLRVSPKRLPIAIDWLKHFVNISPSAIKSAVTHCSGTSTSTQEQFGASFADLHVQTLISRHEMAAPAGGAFVLQ